MLKFYPYLISIYLDASYRSRPKAAMLWISFYSNHSINLQNIRVQACGPTQKTHTAKQSVKEESHILDS